MSEIFKTLGGNLKKKCRFLSFLIKLVNKLRMQTLQFLHFFEQNILKILFHCFVS